MIKDHNATLNEVHFKIATFDLSWHGVLIYSFLNKQTALPLRTCFCFWGLSIFQWKWKLWQLSAAAQLSSHPILNTSTSPSAWPPIILLHVEVFLELYNRFQGRFLLFSKTGANVCVQKNWRGKGTSIHTKSFLEYAHIKLSLEQRGDMTGHKGGRGEIRMPEAQSGK